MSISRRAAGLAYDRRGEGEPLVLLHGTGGSRHVWEPVIPLLELERDVIAVDLPGFGASPAFPDDTPATTAAYAASIEGFLGELGISRPHVAGTSLGGHLALLLGARGSARSVVATSPTGFWSAGEALYTRAFMKTLRGNARMVLPVAPLLARAPAGRRLLLSTSYKRAGEMPPAAVIEAVESVVRAPGFDASWRYTNRERFGGAPATDKRAAAERSDTARALDDIPVTVAWAEQDWFVPRRQADRAREALPKAEHVVLEGCRHLATWDNPTRLAEILLSTSARAAEATSGGGTRAAPAR